MFVVLLGWGLNIWVAAWPQTKAGSWVSGERVGCGNHSLLILHSPGAFVRKVFSYRACVCVHVCTCTCACVSACMLER